MNGLFERGTVSITLEHLVSALSHQRRWPMGVELDFQNVLAAWLDTSNVHYRREFETGEGPIDFYFPEHRIGLELKVKGSAAMVMRQLLRYAQSSEIDALVLLTGHAPLARVAPSLNGKPVHVVTTWAGGL